MIQTQLTLSKCAFSFLKDADLFALWTQATCFGVLFKLFGCGGSKEACSICAWTQFCSGITQWEEALRSRQLLLFVNQVYNGEGTQATTLDSLTANEKRLYALSGTRASVRGDNSRSYCDHRCKIPFQGDQRRMKYECAYMRYQNPWMETLYTRLWIQDSGLTQTAQLQNSKVGSVTLESPVSPLNTPFDIFA